MRQRLFLEHPSWRVKPWALDPAAKSGQHHLLDILVIVPGLLQDHTELERARQGASIDGSPGPISAMLSLNPRPISGRQSPSNDDDDLSALHETLCSRIITQLETLYVWWWRWQAANGDVASTSLTDAQDPEPNPDATAAAEPLHATGAPKQLVFSRFDAAAEIALYNAVLIWLLALVWKLEPVRGAEIIESCAENAMTRATGSPRNSAGPGEGSISLAIPFSPLQRPGAAIGIRGHAMEICRAFEWQSRNQARSDDKGLSPLYLFPMGMAMSVFEDDPGCQSWARALLQRSQVTSSYGAAYGGTAGGSTQATGFGFYVTKQALHPNSVSAREQYEADLKRWTGARG